MRPDSPASVYWQCLTLGLRAAKSIGIAASQHYTGLKTILDERSVKDLFRVRSPGIREVAVEADEDLVFRWPRTFWDFKRHGSHDREISDRPLDSDGNRYGH